MKFQQLLENIQPQKRQSVHITHFEDVVFYGSSRGVLDTIEMAKEFVESPDSLKISSKYDGSPSIFFGPAPVSGDFFVATKGIFNQKPQIFKSIQEIKAKYDGDMAKKLMFAFEYLKQLKPKQILQGDMLYVKGGVKMTQLKGKGFLTFHPNTLYYGVLDGTPESQRVRHSATGS